MEVTLDSLNNKEIAAVALGLLGGTAKPIHTEIIASKMQAISPERFSCVLPGYRHILDKAAVIEALRDGRRNGEMIAGRSSRSGNDGWNLTVKGVNWFKNLVVVDLNEKRSTIPKKEINRFIKRIMHHEVYAAYEADKLSSVSIDIFADFLHVGPDRPKEIVRKQYNKLRVKAEAIGDEGIIKFLEQCRSQFSQFLGKENA